MTIFLIRHGETELGAARVIQRAGTPLSDRGQQQAARLARRLSKLGISRILSSDLRRAEMTAEPIAHATDVPIEFEPLLQERNFGDLRGVPYADLTSDPFAPDSKPPAGETWEVFHSRVDSGWDRLRNAAQETEENLAIVTHGLFCTALVTRHFSLDELTDGSKHPIRFDNTGLTIVESAPPYSVSLLNCTVHLDEGGGEG